MQYGICYGRLNDEDDLHTLTVQDLDAAKRILRKFVTVIPDELDSYMDDIKEWDGETKIVFTHHDDDSFYISVTPSSTDTQYLDEFDDFVDTWEVDDEDHEEE